MSTALSISEVGLRLIKAYEGFRPVDVELVSGQRVAGYGHRVMGGENIHLTEKKAETLLKRDLAPYEAMINDSIFAPLTQSQFDALCSLAFNIGPKKFLESDVVRALNNGRVLDAANGFDVWRKGQINGESYVIDALVRRRTAEKVLFLRPTLRSVRAPRVDLKTTADDALEGQTTMAPERIFEESGFVPAVNFDSENTGAAAVDLSDDDVEADVQDPVMKPSANLIDVVKDMFVERRDPDSNIPAAATPMRRRDDRPGGVLTLSEVFDDEDYLEEDNQQQLEEIDDANDPLIQDLEGFTLDIDTGNDNNTSVKKKADETQIELTELVGFEDADDLAFNDSSKQDLDPMDYIVGQADETSIRGAEMAEPENSVSAPSPIATAAAEVSDRLDALMAQTGENAAPKDNKVLPFRARKSDGNPERLRNQNPIYGGLILTDEADDDDQRLPKGASDKTDELVEAAKANADRKLSEQKDSASRYIANTIAPPESRPSHMGLNLLVIFGMILLAVSVATMMSGFDQRFGVGGEFLSTVGALLGLMITLGSIYYSFKNLVKSS